MTELFQLAPAKACTKCGETKPLDGFYVVSGKYQSACKDCDNARRRHRDHIRYTGVSDITPEQELAMRRKAKKCPLCSVKLTDEPSRPNSKHLDHIVPLGVGGTHTHGNTRILCLACNIKRPKDGSDYTGQTTLWAQGPALVSRPDRRKDAKGHANTDTCKKGLHPWIPENIDINVWNGIEKKRCKLCRQEKDRQKRGSVLRPCQCGAEYAAVNQHAVMCPACTDIAVHRAIDLHTSGMGWRQVAAEVGYGSGWGIAYAAKRAGYMPAPRPAAQPKPPRVCPDCGTPKPEPRPGQTAAVPCQPCTEARAWRAVHLRQEKGWTLRMIADELGCSSVTTVTNLIKTVITIEPKMGRPVSR